MKNIIIDTDIGGDVDDLIALLLAIKSSELKIDLIVTNDEYSQQRAKFAKMFIDLMNIKIPIVSGIESKLPKEEKCLSIEKLIKDRYYIIEKDYISKIKKVVEKNELTYYFCIGAESNLSEFINKNDNLKDKVKIIIMGGSLHRKISRASHNIRCDIKSSINVFNSNWNKKYVLGDVTHTNKIQISKEHNFFKDLKSSKKKHLNFIAESIELFLDKYQHDYFWLHDPLTIIQAINENIIEFTKLNLNMDCKGMITESKDGKETIISKSVDYEVFWNIFNKLIFS